MAIGFLKVGQRSQSYWDRDFHFVRSVIQTPSDDEATCQTADTQLASSYPYRTRPTFCAVPKSVCRNDHKETQGTALPYNARHWDFAQRDSGGVYVKRHHKQPKGIPPHSKVKVKFLCAQLIKNYTIKTYKSTCSWRQQGLEVSGQLHAPAALPPEKEPPILIGEEAGWAPEPVWTIRRSENWETNGFYPVAMILQNTHITQNITPRSNKTQHTRLRKQ
jgi:hypothetical protein